jgi:uncharacterized membrane protein
MLILLGLLTFIAILIVARYLFSDDSMDEVFWGIGITVGIVFLIFVAIIPINRVDTKASIAKFNATSQTLENARKQGNVLENAALQQKIIEQNQWLAEAQYYRSSIWRIWVPESVNNLTPIR